MAALKAVWLYGCPEECAALINGLRDLRGRLAEAPGEAGESRGNGRRIVFGAGVAALFEIYWDRRVVRILRAWTFRRRSCPPPTG
jgi:hypothetical protein